MYKIKLEKFEGPLDLLLRMIEEQEMSISDISLARVADQYIQHLEMMDSLNPTEMSDFLVVAAKLIWIKSKALLPSLDLAEEEGGDLAKQLLIYKEYRDASLAVHKIILKKQFTFVRERPPLVAGDILFNPPTWLTKEKLAKVLYEIIEDLEPIVRLPRGIVRSVISIQEKIQQIKDMVKKNIEIKFHSIVANAKGKVEVIVNFLAVLELLKQRHIVVRQEEMFGEIHIKRGELQ